MSLEQHIPTRSAVALGALDIFYARLNEVHFYVEDTEQENLYFTILKKHFPEINFSKIFPLDGKSNVLTHAKDPANKGGMVKRVYIVDQDFDHLLGSVENIRSVFYLDRYCIENFLIEEDAMIEVIIENNPRIKAEDVRKSLKLNDFIRQSEDALRELFILFFSVQLFGLGIKNCASKAEEFCDPKKPWKISQSRINLYKDSVMRSAVPPKVSPPLTEALMDSRLRAAQSTSPHQLISGKFLLAILFHFVKSKYSLGSTTFDSFVYRVAKNSNLDTLAPTAQKISEYLEST